MRSAILALGAVTARQYTRPVAQHNQTAGIVSNVRLIERATHSKVIVAHQHALNAGAFAAIAE